MNGHIQEHTTGNLNIINARRLRIAGSNLDDLRFTNLTSCNSLLKRLKVVVKSSVKTNLIFQIRALKSIDNLFDLGNIMIDRFLTENMLASLDSLNRNRRMSICRRTDQNCGNLRIVDDLLIILSRMLNTHALSPCSSLII